MAEAGEIVSQNAFLFLTSEELVELLPHITSVFVKKGEKLFHVGDAAKGVYFLETGRLGVLKETGFNDRTQVVALLEQGASVGEGGSLENVCHAATIIAIEDSHLYYLGLEGLATLTDNNHVIVIKIYKRLLYVTNLRLQKSSERLAHIL